MSYSLSFVRLDGSVGVLTVPGTRPVSLEKPTRKPIDNGSVRPVASNSK